MSQGHRVVPLAVENLILKLRETLGKAYKGRAPPFFLHNVESG